MPDLRFEAYRKLVTTEQRIDFRTAMEAEGYYTFFAFVEDFKEALKQYDDAEAAEIGALLRNGRADFPAPGRFSPSWEHLWQELDSLYAAKNETLSRVPPAEREGEWQVLIDNPYVSGQVVCYPGLSFMDAAYLYAYFQKDLKPNEYLRLQKVSHVLFKTGRKEASILPDG